METEAIAQPLALLDWVVIILFIAGSLGIGIYMARRARNSTDDYFKGGGNMGWLMLGTSMVATAFAADTPLALTGWVVTKGISQNWFWWSMVPITMLGVFLYAPLWKRANPQTDMELVYQRYSGNSANALRVGKALWLAFPFGCVNMGWVNKAMTVIINYTVPEFPRIPLLDSAILWLVMVTPLSSDVDSKLREAVKSNQLEPMEIAYDTGILRQPAFWSTFQSGSYGPVSTSEGDSASREQAWNVLKLKASFDLNQPASLPGIPNGLVPESWDSLELTHQIYLICSTVNQYKVLLILFLIVVSYTAISGLWGVIVTDFIQFWVAMVGCVILAVMAVNQVGGLETLFSRMNDLYGADKAGAMMALFPQANAPEFGLFTRPEFWLLILVFWWSYAFTDGGSFFAQRMLSARDERQAALGYLWYGVAHYALRMWPWLIVGFVAAVMFPHLPAANGAMPSGGLAEAGYVRVMLAVLPTGILGLMVASLFAAYMSTISTWVNLGASYLINDVYRPFIAPIRERRVRQSTGDSQFAFSEGHYVRWGVFATLLIALAGIVVALFMNTVSGAWFFLAGFNGGIGVIYLLRWYWWRINAWTELVCLISLLVLSLGMYTFKVPWIGESTFVFFQGTQFAIPLASLFDFPFSLLLTVPVSVCLALVATYLTPQTDLSTLKAFHKKVQAGGWGWRKIDRLVRQDDPTFEAQSPLNARNLILWVLSSAGVCFWLIGLGKLIIGDAFTEEASFSPRIFGILLLIGGSLCLAAVARYFPKQKAS
ncbi:MAG: Na+:solute symporter [Verrucomicrobia bacterium]|nr:Na+:solute symporter [Verrucomicrobiota bacterium]MBT7876131.1 Na+:solute symporter [Verrucomicrobiota bacterium]